MIESIVIDYLSDALGVPTYAEVPEDPPVSFLVVEKTGGGKKDYIQSAVIAVQSYAGSMHGAAALNEGVKGAMDALTTLPDVSRSALNSDYNFPDVSRKKYRYQAIYNITYF